MAKYKAYVTAQTLEEAYALNQKKSSVIVAGNMWLRMCGLNKQTAIDLSALELDRIEETEDAFIIGAMVSLRALETHEGLNAAFTDVFQNALSPVVGTQFRRTATVGGSVFSRFGFSDVSALLLALDAQVVLFKRGAVPLSQFQQEKWDRDILTHIRISKGRRAAVQSVRLSETDIPVLVCAAAAQGDCVRVVLGARPARACVVYEGSKSQWDEETIERIAQQTPMGTNQRASQAYRRRVAPVLMARAVKRLTEEE